MQLWHLNPWINFDLKEEQTVHNHNPTDVNCMQNSKLKWSLGAVTFFWTRRTCTKLFSSFFQLYQVLFSFLLPTVSFGMKSLDPIRRELWSTNWWHLCAGMKLLSSQPCKFCTWFDSTLVHFHPFFAFGCLSSGRQLLLMEYSPSMPWHLFDTSSYFGSKTLQVWMDTIKLFPFKIGP